MSEDVYSKLTIPLKREAQIGQLFWVPSPMSVDSTYTIRIGSWKAGLDISEAKLTVTRTTLSSLGSQMVYNDDPDRKGSFPGRNLAKRLPEHRFDAVRHA